MTKLTLVFVLLFTLLLTTGSWADSLDTWNWRNPLPQGNELNGVAYGNGKFVAVGDLGSILTSTDNGLTWVRRSWSAASAANKEFNLHDVTYGRGFFVAVGEAGDYGKGTASGLILTSSDGINWTSRTSGTAHSLMSIVYGNGMFVTVGGSEKWNDLYAWLTDDDADTFTDSVILTSPDGVNWTSRVSGTRHDLRDVAYANGLFVAVGDDENAETGATTEAVILTSPNGVTWTKRKSERLGDLNGVAYGVAYGIGFFVAVGQGNTLLTSPDGMSWTKWSWGSYQNISDIIYSNGFFVAACDGGTLTSIDGGTWFKDTIGGNLFNSAAYGGGLFIAVGDGGSIISSPATTWTRRAPSGKVEDLHSVAFGNGTLVAVGSDYDPSSDSFSDAAILISSNGSSWTSKLSGMNGSLNDVAFGNSLFVAVGDAGAILTSSNYGVTWSRQTSGTTASLSGVTYGNGLFVATGESGTILTSTNGVNWTSRGLETTADIESVAYGNGLFAAVGNLDNSGTTTTNWILTSADGVTWTNRLSESTDYGGNLSDITFGNGTFVAVGCAGDDKEGKIYSSNDGTNWTKLVLKTTGDLGAAAYGNGLFVVSGDSDTLVSTDGETWARRNSIGNISGVAYGTNTFVLVGRAGSILQSAIVYASCAAPASLSVPITDEDGYYTVSWEPAPSSGVTYTLEEAADSSFTAGVRTVYTGTATNTYISARSFSESYFYRVRATRSGYVSSGWRLAVNGCEVIFSDDGIPPVATLTGAPTGTIKGGTKTLAVGGEGVVAYKYKLQKSGATAALFSSERTVSTALSLSLTTSGDYTLSVIGKDPAGNWQSQEEATTASFTVDATVPPAPVFTAPAAASFINEPEITFTGTAEAGATVRLMKGTMLLGTVEAADGSWSLTPSPFTDGSYVVSATATDAVGNKSTARSLSFTIDTMPPAVPTITGVPVSPTRATTATLTVSGIGVVKYRYALDEGVISGDIPVATRIVLSGLSEGSHTVIVFGIDRAGNIQPTSRSVNWTVDLTAPVATISGVPTGTVKGGTKTMTIGGTGVTYYKYKLQRPGAVTTSYSAQRAVATAISLSLTTSGDYTLSVIGRDAAGNWQPEAEATTASFTVDALPPALTLTNPTVTTFTTTSPTSTIAGTMEPGAAVRVETNTAASDGPATVTEGTWSYEITGLVSGTNIVKIIATDAVGNTTTKSLTITKR